VEETDRLASFYQTAYAQEDGITTQLPTNAAWKQLQADGFGEKGVEHYVSFIDSLYPDRDRTDIKILDYGRSWGYQTWQFRAAGFDCSGFDISVPRVDYGRQILGLPVYSDMRDLSTGFDFFFSSHVIEHMPSPRKLLEEGFDLLKPGGYMIVESPNGSDEFRAHSPAHFHKLWGRVHPFLLSPTYYLQWLQGRPAYFTSWPFGDLAERYGAWDQSQTVMARLDGPSMLMITRKT
jgi:2-polyprenyl-3-methyl-5-hydroxy-6-metoxy-1,4-benzoquinol methylase